MSATVRFPSLVVLGAAVCVALAACTDGTTPDCSDAEACSVTGSSSDASTPDTGTADTSASDAGGDAPGDARGPADAGGQ